MRHGLPEGGATVRTQLTRNELEVAIDEYGVYALLTAMERICREKGAYIREAGDQYLAERWEHRALALADAANDPSMEDA